MNTIFKTCLLFIVLAVIILAIVGIPYYKNNYTANINQDAIIYIPTGATYNQVKVLITPYLREPESFDKVSESQKYVQNVKAGKYKINKGETNKQVVRRLLLGEQEEVHFRLKSFDDMYELAAALGKNLESDSLTFIKYFKTIVKQKGLQDVEELKVYFIPETYYLDWNTSPKEIFSKFEKEYSKFWTAEREEKLRALNMSKMQVYILASIVQREYMKKEELPIIASLYLNRLKKGMKLQSDPTVIYAERKKTGFRLEVKRLKNLSVDSPYNTYKYYGLPPLPICMSESFVIDAVLNPAKTDYLFMCADPKNRGKHLFTADANEHMKNAKAYRDWLDSINIK